MAREHIVSNYRLSSGRFYLMAAHPYEFLVDNVPTDWSTTDEIRVNQGFNVILDGDTLIPRFGPRSISTDAMLLIADRKTASATVQSEDGYGVDPTSSVLVNMSQNADTTLAAA